MSELSLSEQAYRMLRDRICNFELLPNQIVSDYTLSKELNMSRTPIRQALLQLRGDGLLLELPDTSSSYRIAPLTADEVADIFDFREGLELCALRLGFAGGYLDRDALAALRSDVQDMEQLQSGNLQEYFAADQRFHTALVTFSHNRRLSAANEGLSLQLQRMRFITYIDLSLQKKASDDHQALLAAMEAGDEDEAAAILSRHIRTTKSDYIEILNNKELAENSVRALRFLSSQLG